MTSQELKDLQATLWKSADDLRANSDLRSSEYSTPVMGLIFLKFADNKYRRYEDEIKAEYAQLKGTRREKTLPEIAVAKCGFYLPDNARYSTLLNLPEAADIDQALKNAMVEIEKHKPELAGVLPQDEYFKLTRLDKSMLSRLLQNFANIPDDADGDLFGQIYEYFLGNFALAEGQGGGEFFTPRSVVRLMIEIIEPHQGTVFDPACGSGGMFVQSAAFVEAHRQAQEAHAADALYVYGQEKTLETVKLAKMNLVVNGLRGEVQQTNTYYEDPYGSFGRFDYVLANPPFNVDDVNLKRVESDRRFNTYGIPRNKGQGNKKAAGNETVPNGNYLWINLFATSLKENGRAALVMANSASDARHSEADIRQTLIEKNLIYGMLTLPSNMFWTVTLPATLWFFDKGKQDERILFIDARNIFTPVDRAHREFSPEQIINIGLISRLHRGDRAAFVRVVDDYFAQGMARLAENAAKEHAVAAQLLNVLDDAEGQDAVQTLLAQWADWSDLQAAYEAYLVERGTLLAQQPTTIEAENTAQHQLQAQFEPFFAGLHAGLKALDKTVHQYEKQEREANERRGIARDLKGLKTALETVRAEVKDAESFFAHIHWLQERFPQAAYEDVTGLCKLATLEDIKEQDYSLNPGRYVGVVIEEDGKTEEEFISEMLDLHGDLEKLNNEAHQLENVIMQNLKQLVNEDA
ncbi:MAG: SAM-dependent DNA methyltransferase [Chloroflexi bacterium]|nr:SAM-dependent DNA methyltransferase [Chloroflexota bacterium]